MLPGETHSEHSEDVLRELRIKDKDYKPIHELIRPSWTTNIPPKTTFITANGIKESGPAKAGENEVVESGTRFKEGFTDIEEGEELHRVEEDWEDHDA